MTEIKHLLLGFIGVVLCAINGKAECGYKSCHPIKSDQLNIHLVPHTHDDLGWLNTYEQYYYGSHQAPGVRYIIDSVVDALQRNSDRRFIYVETGFFWKWWLQQDENRRKVVRDLVNNGQLEFISGGWSMNDEAATYYQSTIDQMTWGLRKLNEAFGECGRPKVGWQIDPFGHSREMASILAQLGYDGFFINRIDYQDHDQRVQNRSMEFVWRGSPDNLGESTDIYTNVLYRHYSAPGGLCFDITCNEEPFIDDPTSPEYDAEAKALDFINNWITPATDAYASNNILVPMGDDFRYQYAGKNFLNMDKLINYMNGRDFDGRRYNVIYSTPSCYLNAVYQSTNGTLNTALKTDDFFPYASSAHNFWTGYFSSRPTGKGYSRYSNNLLQICKQLSVITNLTSVEDTSRLDTLREALGVFQHHDDITGTEKEHVTHDYMHLLHNGITQCEEITNQALANLVHSTDSSFTTCPLLNISECSRTEKEDTLVITVYNPLGRPVDKYVRLPIVDTSEITITDPSGQQLLTQIIPINAKVLDIPGRNSLAKYELIFKAENLPPLGYKSFYFQRNPQKKPIKNVAYQDEGQAQITESNGRSVITMTSQNGLKLGLGIAYFYYTGFVENPNSDDSSPSTPYVFRPDPDIPLQQVSQIFGVVTYSGPLVTEYHWDANNGWFSYVYRTYENSSILEFVHLVGPLPYEDKGIEVIVRFDTDLEYDDKIYTDTNGREIIERVRDFRPTWNFVQSEPEAGNYYPIVSGVSVTNSNNSAGFAVVNDRAQGGGSIEYQNIEFMIHRNTIKTGGGVGEPLNEEAFGTGVVTTGSHYLILTGSDLSQSSDPTPKEIAQQVSLDSWIYFSSPNGQSFEDYKAAHVMEFSALGNVSLPRNVHILTLEPWGPSTVLLRLENFVGKEDTWHSGTSTVNVQELFSAFNVESLRETTLGGNQWLEENSRIRFNAGKEATPHAVQADDDFNVTLEPMQIRTFVVTIS